ncbi:hypothetical protein [Salmonirosea aquatica]
MAKFAHLQKTEFMVNLAQVESISKIMNGGKEAIVFNYYSGRSDIWLFESSSAREKAFADLRTQEYTEYSPV